jgi:glucose-6-phosphate isomerase, archaeal
MHLAWTRPQKDLIDVLMNPTAKGPETAYWIFSELSEKKWSNMTVLAPGKYGTEFVKTFGHYHPPNTLETSKFIGGEGFYMLQKKHIEGSNWIDDLVDEVFMVKFESGDTLTLNDQFAHAWSNVGNEPLVVLDDWRIKHSDDDYQSIKRLHGMCFYIIAENGLKFVPNPNYKNHPEPKVVTAKEFQRLYPV